MIDAKISRDMVKKIRDTIYEKMLRTDVAQLDKMKNMFHAFRLVKNVMNMEMNMSKNA